MPQPKIDCVHTYGDLRVRINGMLHLHVVTKKVTGIQSWYEGDAKRVYFIEISFDSGEPMLMEYVDFSNWSRILKLLDENL
jgi:hypothetical protein